MQNVVVLKAPDKPKTGGLGGPTSDPERRAARRPDEDALELAFASDNRQGLDRAPATGWRRADEAVAGDARAAALRAVKPITVSKLLGSGG